MHDWQQSLRRATEALCAAITELPVATAPSVSLAQAAIDIVQTQERVTRTLSDRLAEQLRWRKDAERRLALLEAAQHERETREYTPGRDAASRHGAVVMDGGAATRAFAKTARREGEGLGGEVSKAVQETPRKRARLFENVTPAKLPVLPTLREVEGDFAKRWKERRRKERFQPLPCAKCRLRKRALLMREKRYVDEGIFERWAAKPGNCLGYLHMEDPVPDDQPRSALTFEETATQSPPR